jgi:hypothetical protein
LGDADDWNWHGGSVAELLMAQKENVAQRTRSWRRQGDRPVFVRPKWSETTSSSSSFSFSSSMLPENFESEDEAKT